jgi:two-component system sensor histidine kinase SenX3
VSNVVHVTVLDIVVAAAVVVALLAFAAWLVSRRAREALRRRLRAAAAQLGSEKASDARSLEEALSELERATSAAVSAVAESTSEAVRLRRALDALRLAVVITDESGETVFSNQRATALMSGRHGDAIAAQAVEELLESTEPGGTEERTIELYGPPRRTLVVRTESIDNGSRVIGTIAVIEDVSEHRRLEEVRRDFVANVSHELKTPMGALGLLAETLLGETEPEVARRLAERIHHEAFRISRVIDDLIDLSRLENESSPPREPVPVNLVLAEAAERVRAAAEQRAVDVVVEEPPPELTVPGDRRQLTSAIYNLLENAVKFSYENGKVHASARREGDEAVIRISDAGIGIPSRDLERIFERFYRVDPGRGRATGGTGLGLAIVRHVAANHQGNVQVESREGEGSTFILRLPTQPKSR